MTKILYIIDIRLKQSHIDLFKYIDNKDYEILSLSPYSTFLLDELNLKYITFHDLISIEEVHDNILSNYEKFESIFYQGNPLNFLFREFAFLITYEKFIKQVEKYINKRKQENIRIYYITDSNTIKGEKINFLHESYFFTSKSIDKIINIYNRDNNFYKKNNLINAYTRFKHTKNFLLKVVIRYFTNKKEYKYDNKYFADIYASIKPIKVNSSLEIEAIDKIFADINLEFLDLTNSFFYSQYLNIINNYKTRLLSNKVSNIKIRPFSYLSSDNSFIEVMNYHKNNIPVIMMQHGAYLYDHLFLKYNEIYPASLNFVLNEYTKIYFQKRGSINTQLFKSIVLNYEIQELRKEFDYLYITHCTTYSHNAVYIDGEQSYYAMDANNIYQRHKNIIELFGTKFKDKKICIKIQPGIMLGTMLYIPFLELSEKYKNITIEFSVPIQKLIGKSKYIISDYFSSEFINRELHYKRDIILFNAAPLIVPEETVEDMKKMFILVETVDDFQDKVKNIEEITKNRKRYDDIIEYYSSKKCDTKKVVTEILEKELNK